jgi:GNAT superfamily N-acetyltransferase
VPDKPTTIRPATPSDRDFIAATLIREFASTQIWSRRQPFEAMDLPALVALQGGERVGVAVYRVDHAETELLALAATHRQSGAGSLLLQAVIDTARQHGSKRLFLTTTNDNLDALRFYQRRGMRLVALHVGAMDEARRAKPTIPEIGSYGIPMRDDLELEIVLSS